ncbi:unnamed protein product [Choristocarpus tenellus]
MGSEASTAPPLDEENAQANTGQRLEKLSPGAQGTISSKQEIAGDTERQGDRQYGGVRGISTGDVDDSVAQKGEHLHKADASREGRDLHASGSSSNAHQYRKNTSTQAPPGKTTLVRDAAEYPTQSVLPDKEDGEVQAGTGKTQNYASRDSGAVVLEGSPGSRGMDNVLVDSKDKYAISPCEEKQWVVVGLSEDIMVRTIKIGSYEAYSSLVKTFQVLASQSMPVTAWLDLGTFTAKYAQGEQSFDIPQPAFARYLKFKFLDHYGDEFYCTVSQIKVHGSTMLESFQHEWQQSSAELQEMQDFMVKETTGTHHSYLVEEATPVSPSLAPPDSVQGPGIVPHPPVAGAAAGVPDTSLPAPVATPPASSGLPPPAATQSVTVGLGGEGSSLVQSDREDDVLPLAVEEDNGGATEGQTKVQTESTALTGDGSSMGGGGTLPSSGYDLGVVGAALGGTVASSVYDQSQEDLPNNPSLAEGGTQSLADTDRVGGGEEAHLPSHSMQLLDGGSMSNQEDQRALSAGDSEGIAGGSNYLSNSIDPHNQQNAGGGKGEAGGFDMKGEGTGGGSVDSGKTELIQSGNVNHMGGKTEGKGDLNAMVAEVDEEVGTGTGNASGGLSAGNLHDSPINKQSVLTKTVGGGASAGVGDVSVTAEQAVGPEGVVPAVLVDDEAVVWNPTDKLAESDYPADLAISHVLGVGGHDASNPEAEATFTTDVSEAAVSMPPASVGTDTVAPGLVEGNQLFQGSKEQGDGGVGNRGREDAASGATNPTSGAGTGDAVKKQEIDLGRSSAPGSPSGGTGVLKTGTSLHSEDGEVSNNGGEGIAGVERARDESTSNSSICVEQGGVGAVPAKATGDRTSGVVGGATATYKQGKPGEGTETVSSGQVDQLSSHHSTPPSPSTPKLTQPPGVVATAACLEQLSFSQFRDDMLSRKHQTQQPGGVAIGGQYESIFKTLMNKIKTLEINQSLFNLYIENLQDCYHGVIQELLIEQEHARASREELEALATQAMRSMHLIHNNDQILAVQALQSKMEIVEGQLLLTSLTWFTSMICMFYLILKCCVGMFRSGGRQGSGEKTSRGNAGGVYDNSTVGISGGSDTSSWPKQRTNSKGKIYPC